jgi:hypothetical protein
MKKLISFHIAARISIGLYLIFIVFHLCVIAGLVPMNIVWGGKVSRRSELIPLEIVSISVLLICTTVTAIRAGYLPYGKNSRLPRLAMYLLALLFALNTVGNLFAESAFERWAFTPVTALLCVLSLRLAFEPMEGSQSLN